MKDFVGDNDHGDGIPLPRCASCGVTWADHMRITGVCLNNKALKEDLKASLEAHDEMRLEIAQLTKERDDAQVDQRLIEELWERRTDMTELQEQIKLLCKERDEARRQVCELCVLHSRSYHGGEEKECAKDRGWDCYKKEETS